MKNREILFSPGDAAPRSRNLATNLLDYNGDTQAVGEACSSAPNSELCQAETNTLAMWSYLLNSIFTHRSCRYALDGSLPGFATETVIGSLTDPNVILFSPRNSVGMLDPGSDFHAPGQDDYDTWSGEGALVKWGTGSRPNEGWIDHKRFSGSANYVYTDGHAKTLPWGKARVDQFPDHVVRHPVSP